MTSYEIRVVAKLWMRTDIVGSCWIIRSNQTYARAGFHGLIMGVHQISACIFLGLSPRQKHVRQVNHRPECTSKKCWNPEHIYIGTPRNNTHDAIKAGTFHHWGKKLDA